MAPSPSLTELYKKMFLHVELYDATNALVSCEGKRILQRVMDEYSGERPASKGGRPFGATSPAGSAASQWDSAEHVQTTISHLSSTLAGIACLLCAILLCCYHFSTVSESCQLGSERASPPAHDMLATVKPQVIRFSSLH